jgi:hypothetical protein
MGLQHRLDPVALGQVGVADDAGGDAGLAVAAAGAHCGDAGDELGFAHRAHLARAGGAVHRMALQEHAADDGVAGGGGVFQELGQQIAHRRHLPGIAGARDAGAVPQVVMGVDDRQAGIERGLRQRLGEPIGARGENAAVLGDRLVHACFLRWCRRPHHWPPSLSVATDGVIGDRPCQWWPTLSLRAQRSNLGQAGARLGRLRRTRNNVRPPCPGARSAGFAHHDGGETRIRSE